MGWTHQCYEPGKPRRQFLAELTEAWEGKNGHRARCLSRVYRGAPHQGVLWSLWERTGADGRTECYILCHLIAYWKTNGRGEGWAYKDMSAAMHPYQYSCPLSWLEKAAEDNEDWQAWAVGVRAWWEVGRKGLRGRDRKQYAYLAAQRESDRLKSEAPRPQAVA